MKKGTKAQELISEINKTLQLLEKNNHFYQTFKDKEFQILGKSTSSAMILSQIITDFYTGLETLFHRISQFFGNTIEKNSWHKNLLKNMTLEIKDIRIAVIGDSTAAMLDEILRFRHFRRYYFDTEYDWDRIEFIEKKYCHASKMIKSDLSNFVCFLKKIV